MNLAINNISPIRPDLQVVEPRVADLDDGYTRIANELLEAVMLAGLSQHQLLVFMAVMRKTYGFNKKLTGLVTISYLPLPAFFRTNALLLKAR